MQSTARGRSGSAVLEYRGATRHDSRSGGDSGGIGRWRLSPLLSPPPHGGEEEGGPAEGWDVDFNDALASGYVKSGTTVVREVRGGP